MFELSTLTTFVAVVLGLFVIPGPAVLLVLTRTVQGGRKTGILTGLGIASGDFVHALCAAVGLSALLMTSALAFNVVKIVGACYLVYLGIKALREPPADPTLPKVAAVSASRAFWQAIPAEVRAPRARLDVPAVCGARTHFRRAERAVYHADRGVDPPARAHRQTGEVAEPLAGEDRRHDLHFAGAEGGDPAPLNHAVGGHGPY
jgi:arginine exporter protein ArgO